ncbi:MAG: L-2-amino-thiazoline-4-carboxylic acid hydrolase [Chloroflexi bacterium]|nr:L-2-amino-thiazoline-4-carboxylic acid hydrolase [Chloroflexota bacterium]
MERMEASSKEQCALEVRKMARLFALMYYHFATTIVEEMGEERGKEVVSKVVARFGAHRGEEIKKRVGTDNLANLIGATDLPETGWESRHIRMSGGESGLRVTYCPLADTWKAMGADALGQLYCAVDEARFKAYNLEGSFVHAKNVLQGDDCCEVYIRFQE